MDNNGLAFAGDYDLQTCNYISSMGQGINLKPILVELSFFEDLFATVMSGNIVITDSTNIFGYFSSSGNEFLVISLDLPGLGPPINKTFRIYNKSKINSEKPTSQAIRLDFCSEQLMVSKTIEFSKSYNSMLISDMVADIGKTYLKINNINTETTQGITNLNIPHYNPLQAMNWLASKARSSYVGATYLFYENRDGFNFQSLQKLMDTTTPTRTYNYNQKNVVYGDVNTDLFDVSRYEIVNTPNTLDNLLGGKYGAALYTFDPLRGVFGTGQLNADDLYGSSTTLGTGKPYNNFQNFANKNSADSYPAYKKYYPTNAGQNNAQISPYIAGKQQVTPTNIENWMLERNSQLLQFMNIKVKVVVPGDVRLRVGDVIQFNMPSIENQSGQSAGQLDRKLDPYYSGLYMISAVRHRLDIKIFESILELCKDSLNSDLPQVSFSDTTSGILNV